MQAKKPLVLILAAALAGAAPALAQTGATDRPGKPSVVNAPPANYSDSVARLMEASQRLREAIQAMAQHPAGERRDYALNQAHKALFDAQQSIVNLPVEAYRGEGGSPPNYTKSMERLQQAADKLRQAIQAMADRPAGDQRAAAIDEAREALLETQQAMVWLPPSVRTGEGASAAGGSAR